MSELTHDTTLVHGEDVIFRNLEGEAVLVHLKAGIYFGLDEVGTRIWDWIGEHGQLGPVLDEIVANYEVEREQAEADLMRLMDDLVENKLVRVG